MKKVLFFCAWFPNKIHSLAGSFVLEHAKCLNGKIQLAIFHIHGDFELDTWFRFESFKMKEIEIYKISFRRFNHLLFYPLNIFSYLLANIIGYLKVKQQFGIADLNHVHVLTKTAILPYFLKLINKTPYVISEHWSRYLPERNSYHGVIRKRITKMIVKNSDGLCTVSKDLMIAMNNHGLRSNNSMIISNVVNPLFFKKYNKVINAEFRFLHVSGLQDAIKNISGILKASARLKEEGLKFKFDIVGDDEERVSLQNFSNQLQLREIVSFHGKLYGESLIKKYREADAFVLFSNFETQSCVLLESFAMGLPVIATNVGGIPEIVNQNNGILINPKEENELFEAMKHLIFGNKSFNGDLIWKQANKKHSYQAVSKQIMKFYDVALTQ